MQNKALQSATRCPVRRPVRLATEDKMTIYRTTIVLLLFLAVAGYADEPRRYIFEEIAVRNDTGDTAPVTEVSIWDQSGASPRLVCKVVKQSDLVVSIMPTPIQTDAVRPTAHFVTVGDGWSPSMALYLDEQGPLYRSADDARERDNELTEERLLALLGDKATKKMPYAYLIVEQNTPYKRFEEVFHLIAPAFQSVGVGWQQGWW